MALSLCLLDAAPASAQQVGDRQVARGHFDQGVALVQRRRWEEALVELTAARALAPGNPPVHYYLGRAQRELGQRRAALESFREFFRLGVRIPDALRREVEGYVVELQDSLGRLRLQVRPEAAEVRLDGERVAAGAGELVLDPGSHQVETRAEGYLDDARRVELAAGAQVTVEIALSPRPASPPPITSPALPPSDPVASPEPELEPDLTPAAPTPPRGAYPLALLLGGLGHVGPTSWGFGGLLGLRLATHHELRFELGRSTATCIDYGLRSLGYVYVANATGRFRPYAGATLALFVPEQDAPCVFEGTSRTPTVSVAALAVGGARFEVFRWLGLFADVSLGYASGNLGPFILTANGGVQFAIPL